MHKRAVKLLVLVFFIIFGFGSFMSTAAQEIRAEVVDFGAGQVFSAVFMAQRVGDLVLFQNGSVVSANLLNETLELELPSGEIQSFTRDDITGMRFNITDEGIETRIFPSQGSPVDGTLLTDLQLEYAISENLHVDMDQMSAIILKIKPVRIEQTQTGEDGEEQVLVTETVQLDFSQIFPIMTRMFASMSKFDTVILPDGQLASIELSDRDALEITIDSVNFGRFTFPVDQISWVEFAQSEEERDVLVLKDGDRVSGQIVIEGDLNGTLALGDGAFNFNEDDLRLTFRQLVFQLPEGLFGGGGAGHGVFITEDNQ